MGLFSKIKSGFKKVVKGVKKVFKKAVKAVSKVAKKVFSSKIGKAVLIAASVFTMGTALAAGAAAWSNAAANGAAFFGKFVAGAKGFLGSMVGIEGAGMGNPANLSATAEGASIPGYSLGGGLAGPAEAVQNLSGAASTVTQAAAEPLAGVANTANAATSAKPGLFRKVPGINPSVEVLPKEPGLFSRAATAAGDAVGSVAGEGVGNAVTGGLNAAGRTASKVGGSLWKWAQTEGGSNIIGSVIAGYGEGMAAEAEWERQIDEKRRFEKMWANTDLADRDIYDVEVPSGWMSRARDAFGAAGPSTPGTGIGGIEAYQGGVPWARPAGGQAWPA